MPSFADPSGLEKSLWRKAYSIFEAALELPVDEREQFARVQSASEPELLNIIVELLASAAEDHVDDASQLDPGPVPGSVFGKYRIVEKLGRGAMGKVYQAQDTELGRVVALKFLQAGSYTGSSPDPGRRLVKEARAASALNHPNIVTVYEVVKQGGELALAMELVDGTSLREYCGMPQPIEAVVRWMKQIAEALAATHARGIIHRDIKPENVMVRRDGYVKVLDFGLATGLVFPDQSMRSTVTGMMGGTLNYMSPEQTRGEAPGPASDIFSLGTVLYELVCCRHPFLSPSPIDTAYAIAHHEPAAPESLRPGIPTALSSLILDMLAKAPEQRPSTKELGDRLGAVESYPSAVGHGIDRRNRLSHRVGHRSRRMILGAVTVAVVAIAAFATYGHYHPTPKYQLGAEPIRYNIQLPTGSHAVSLAISPKGDRIAYVAVASSGSMLFTRFLDATESHPVAGSESAAEPFFSPDGQEIAFFTPGHLRVAGASGYRDLAPVPQTINRHGFWGKDGFIYFANSEADVSGIWRVPESGGKPERVLDSLNTPRGVAHRFGQQLLPGALLYSVNYGPVSRSIEWLEVSDRSTHRLIERGMGGAITPTGHLVYYRNGALIAAPFNAAERKLTGSPVEVLATVMSTSWAGPAAQVSENGTLVYLSQPDLPRRNLYWMSTEGKRSPLNLPPADYEQGEVSPDGKRVAIIRQDGMRVWTVWIYELKSGAWTRLLETPVERPRAVWSPDSQSLVLGLEPTGGEYVNLYRVSLARPDQPERLTEQPNFGQFPTSWSARANAILFLEGIHRQSQSDIMLLPLAGDTKPRVLVATDAIERPASFSPDGRRFAYSTESDGHVYVRDVDGNAPPVRISADAGGMCPLWAPDGKRIYYLLHHGGLIEVPLDHKGNPLRPRQLLSGGFVGASDMWTRGYSLAPDGRFLVIHNLPEERPPLSEIHVVVNWFTELNRLAPVP